MNKSILSFLFMTCLSIFLFAEDNHTKESNTTVEHNKTTQKTEQNNDTNKTMLKSKLEEQQVKEQMEREKKYAKEMKFYQGDEYDLKAVEVNEKSLDHIPVIEPDYDFDITDVYRDDL